MRISNSANFVFASFLSLSAGLNHAAFAQLTPELGVPIPQERKKTVPIDIKNVKPSIMVWWLDPHNHEVPSEFQTRESLEKKTPLSQAQINELSPIPDYVLPKGIDKIVAIDPQSVIMVVGTETAIAELRETIEQIDKPMRKVEVELHYLMVPSQHVNQLGLTTGDQTGTTGSLKIAKLPPDYQKRVETLIAEKKARVITAPRLFAFDKVAGEMTTIVDEAFALSTGETGIPQIAVDEEIARVQALFNLRLRRNWTVSAKPKLQNDGTIDLNFTSSLDYQVGDLKSEQTISKPFSSATQTFKGLKSGESVVLMGGNMKSVMGAGTALDELIISVRARELKGMG